MILKYKKRLQKLGMKFERGGVVMWVKETMSFAESLILSGMGFVVVLGVLALLAIMIILFSKIFNLVNKMQQGKIKEIEETEELSEEEIGAVVLSVICEELGTDPDNIRVTYIQEI